MSKRQQITVRGLQASEVDKTFHAVDWVFIDWCSR